MNNWRFVTNILNLIIIVKEITNIINMPENEGIHHKL